MKIMSYDDRNKLKEGILYAVKGLWFANINEERMLIIEGKGSTKDGAYVYGIELIETNGIFCKTKPFKLTYRDTYKSEWI